MNGQVLRSIEVAGLKRISKSKIIRGFVLLRGELLSELENKTERITILTQENEKLRKEREDQKERKINAEVNQPSSKKPEWDKDGNPKKPKKKKKKKKRKKRPGCGNESKSDIQPDETNHIPLCKCPDCGKDLSKQEGTEKPSRIVEDIVPPPEKTVISEEIEETKWCPDCKKMVSSKTEVALPGSDIGLNATIEMAWLWVMCALSFPNIQSLFLSFKTLKISTAGISRMMIRLAGILAPVYAEILEDVKRNSIIWADETGWRVKGKLWWLWAFSNKRSAYYWPDRSRGSPVVEKVLGTIFLGLLIVDGWGGYNAIECARQTCMAHIFRKIRAFIDADPQYRTLMKFYLMLRRIIRDAEKLQKERKKISELAFRRRLKTLRKRLHKLLRWKNPNPKLKDIIKKVRRQEDFVLTFVEHDEAPSHNNFAEYIIKRAVLKRKVSGGSMSEDGFKAYACIQSIAQTCHLRNISFHKFLRTSLVHYIRTGKPMLLSQYESTMTEKTRIAA